MKEIELLEKASDIVSCCGYKCGEARPIIDQALALLKQPEPEDCASCDAPLVCAAKQKVGLGTDCQPEQRELIRQINKALGLIYDTVHPMPKAAISRILSQVKVELDRLTKALRINEACELDLPPSKRTICLNCTLPAENKTLKGKDGR